MHDPCCIVQVGNRVKKLLKIMTSKRLAEASSLVFYFYELEQIAKFYKLKDNEKYLDCLPFLFDDNLSLNIVFDELDDIWMVESTHQLYFVLQHLLKHINTNLFNVMSLYNFYGHKCF